MRRGHRDCSSNSLAQETETEEQEKVAPSSSSSMKMLETTLPLKDLSPCASTNLNHQKASEQQCTNMPEEVESQLSEWNMKADSEASSASCLWRSVSSSWQRCPKNPSPNLTPVTSSVFYSPPSDLYYHSSPEFLAEPASIINKEKQRICFKPFSTGKRSRMAKDGSEEDEIDSVKNALRLCGYMRKSGKSRMAEQGRAEDEIESVRASISCGYMPKSKKSIMAEEGREKDELDKVKASLRRYTPNSETSRMGEDGKEEEKEIDTVKASLRGYRPKSESLLSSRNSRDRTSANRKETELFLQMHHQKPQIQQKTEPVGAVQKLVRTEQQGLPVSNEFITASNDNLASDRIFLAVNKDQEERNDNVRPRATIPLSDSQYTRSNYSEFGDSDIESSIRSFLPSQARAGDSLMAAVERNEKEAMLLAWKEAAMLKLMNRLKKKEAEISDWEHKKALKYKTEMKHFEQRKMQEKREKAYLKMEQKIRKTEKEAEEKKVKETETVTRKISKTTNAADRISCGGKLQWMLC
ncbi:hypothetical protein ACLOJK_033322 [Asimina triloba]